MTRDDMTVDELAGNLRTALSHIPKLKAKGELPHELDALMLLSPGPHQQAEVVLYRRDGRKVRADAGPEYRDLNMCDVRVRMGPALRKEASAADEGEAKVGSPPEGEDDHETRVVRALAHAESRPGIGFVALTWLRDTLLPSDDASWTQDGQRRQAAIKAAIDRGLIVPSKVPNPKNPQFPTTAVRLNRASPLVQKVLQQLSGYENGFSPLEIRGRPLSHTVLEDRR